MYESENSERLVHGCMNADFSNQILIFQYLKHIHDLHTFAPLESNRKTMKSASGKRPPDEAHGPGEVTIRPQQCSEAWGSIEKKVHTGTLL